MSRARVTCGESTLILSGEAIVASVERGDIVIDPFVRERVTTNSYDFSLHNLLGCYLDPVLDAGDQNAFALFDIPRDGYVLKPGELYLGCTQEVMGSTKYVPIIKGKSSVARLGLFIHITADLIDVGSVNRWTLHLVPTVPVRVFAGMMIGQVTFWTIEGEVELYQGKYQGSMSPMPSMSWRDREVWGT